MPCKAPGTTVDRCAPITGWPGGRWSASHSIERQAGTGAAARPAAFPSRDPHRTAWNASGMSSLVRLRPQTVAFGARELESAVTSRLRDPASAPWPGATTARTRSAAGTRRCSIPAMSAYRTPQRASCGCPFRHIARLRRTGRRSRRIPCLNVPATRCYSKAVEAQESHGRRGRRRGAGRSPRGRWPRGRGVARDRSNHPRSRLTAW